MSLSAFGMVAVSSFLMINKSILKHRLDEAAPFVSRSVLHS